MVKPAKKILGAALAMSAGAVVSAFTPVYQQQQQSALLRPKVTPLHATATPDAVIDGGLLSMVGSSSSSIILDRPLTTLPTIESNPTRHDHSEQQSPNSDWILRIYNDNINTREYVAVCLVQVVGLCESRAYYTMQDAHDHGIAKVGEYNQEVAECYEEQLVERGIMCDVVASE
jgi:ATP-dependent Clp protease adapter protein ClpS